METPKTYGVHIIPDIRIARANGDEIAAMEDPDPETLAAQMKTPADEHEE